MTQRHLRIFVSYASEATSYESMIRRLLEDLHTQEAEVIIDDDPSRSETEILGELQRCNKFLLIQTPEAVVSPHVRMITYTANTLILQGVLQGVRYVMSPIPSEEIPEEWRQGMITIDATDEVHAKEQLIYLLFDKVAAPAAFISSATTPSSLPVLSSTTSFSSSSTVPSNPPTPNHDVHQGTTASQIGYSLPLSKDWPQRKISRPVWIIFLLAIGLAIFLTLSPLFHGAKPSQQKPAASHPSATFGEVHFTSSNLLDSSNSQGLNDGLLGDFENLPPAAPGKRYYAWLLPDSMNGEGTTVLVGTLSVSSQGTAQINFEDPTHMDLLAIDSRLLITEESMTTTPDLPTPDKTAWRYYAAIPQTPNPKDMMGNLSLLTHLRHLLVDEPHLEKLGLRGGLVTWLQQYVRKTLEWSSAARGIGAPTDPDLMHRHFIRILDYLDGSQYVEKSGDVPPRTPLIVKAPIGLLTFDPIHQDPPGYVLHVDMHLQSLASSPGATSSQQVLATKVDQALNDIKGHLEKARQDAKVLVRMSDRQILDANTVPILDDLVTQIETAYIGDYDATSGIREGGVIWVHDQIEHLASFPVMPYSEKPAGMS